MIVRKITRLNNRYIASSEQHASVRNYDGSGRPIRPRRQKYRLILLQSRIDSNRVVHDAVAISAVILRRDNLSAAKIFPQVEFIDVLTRGQNTIDLLWHGLTSSSALIGLEGHSMGGEKTLKKARKTLIVTSR